jgi:Arm DNA-binding domain
VTKPNALTAVFVKQRREPGVYRDGQGLLLRVERSGAKRWVLRITIRGRCQDVGLGSARDVSLQEAREKAAERRRDAREGRDPVAAQRASRTKIPTFTEAAEKVHEQQRAAWGNGKHVDQWLNTLREFWREVYWLCTNAEREIAQREQQVMPVAAARDRHLAAGRRLGEAEAGKRAADAAAISEAAKPGCKVNCAQLLSAAQLRATQELAEARASLAALPQAQAVDGLAARLGVAAWAWDLWMAALRSIGVMGASIGVGLALHPRKPAGALPVVYRVAQPRMRNPMARIESLTNTKRPVENEEA